jgi:hypothetical protein
MRNRTGENHDAEKDENLFAAVAAESGKPRMRQLHNYYHRARREHREGYLGSGLLKLTYGSLSRL